MNIPKPENIVDVKCKYYDTKFGYCLLKKGRAKICFYDGYPDKVGEFDCQDYRYREGK